MTDIGAKPPGRRERSVVALLLLIVNLATALVFLLYPLEGVRYGVTDFPLDDGWIHMVYVRGLATELRPTYNPGEMESGMTSPLWVVINAVFYQPGRLMNLNPTVMPKALSLLFGWMSSLVLYLLIRRRTGSVAVALAAALILSIDPQWCFSRVSGMEVTLFAFLLLISFLALELGRDFTLGTALGLATLARPEGIVILGVIAPLRALTAWREKNWKALVRVVAPFGVLVGAWVVYNLAVTGHPLPNTFYVKAQTGSLLRMDNLAILFRDMVLKADFFRNGVGVVLFVVGAGYLLRFHRAQSLGLLAAPFLFTFALSITHTFVQAEPYYWARYLHPTFPFYIFPLFFAPVALSSLLGRMKASPGTIQRVTLASVVVLFLLVAAPMAGSFPRRAALFSMNCRDIAKSNVHMGKWIARNTPRGVWVATMDAGAIRYFSDRPILDLGGLNNAALAHHPDKGRKIYDMIMKEVKPDYFVLWPGPYEMIVRPNRMIPIYSVTNDLTICDCPTQSTLIVFTRGRW